MKTVKYHDIGFYRPAVGFSPGLHMVDSLFGQSIEPTTSGYSNWIADLDGGGTYARYNYQTMEVTFATASEVAFIMLKEQFGG